jgi:hypothetical protein
MSSIASNAEDLILNADGGSSTVKIKINGTEKASISSAGAFTSTTIDATKLTGALPAISGAALTGVGVAGITSAADATAITITSAERIGINHTTPEARLEIDGGGETGLKVLATVANEYAAIFQSASTNSTPIADFRKSGGTSQLQVLADGRGLSQFTASFWARVNMEGTFSITGSHNVSSVTDRGVGKGTANFANNLSNANYCVVGSAFSGGGENDQREFQHSNERTWSTSAWDWCTMDELETANDITGANMIGFGG